MVVPPDTTIESARLHLDALRKISLTERLKIALELSDLTHAFAVAGIRQRHPGCSDEDARKRLAELLYC